jgi:hypothetical protein
MKQQTQKMLMCSRGWLARQMGFGVLALFLLGGLTVEGRDAETAAGAASRVREYKIKAAFLLNFMQFVEWPAPITTNRETALVLGICGEDPFGSTLDDTVKGETVRGHPLVIKRARRAADLTECHLVFVCQSEKDRLKEIFQTSREGSALMVSDIEHFCPQGGMIGLVTENGRIKFEINQAAAEQKGLRISSKLLRLGRTVAKQ